MDGPTSAWDTDYYVDCEMGDGEVGVGTAFANLWVDELEQPGSTLVFWDEYPDEHGVIHGGAGYAFVDPTALLADPDCRLTRMHGVRPIPDAWGGDPTSPLILTVLAKSGRGHPTREWESIIRKIPSSVRVPLPRLQHHRRPRFGDPVEQVGKLVRWDGTQWSLWRSPSGGACWASSPLGAASPEGPAERYGSTVFPVDDQTRRQLGLSLDALRVAATLSSRLRQL
jgi:hypothetical protein